jgi:hypothetical protein
VLVVQQNPTHTQTVAYLPQPTNTNPRLQYTTTNHQQ